MAIRRLRQPRAGEVIAWLTVRTRSVKLEKWKDGDQLRVDPAPCCKKSYKGGGALVISPKSGLWKCFACGTAGNFFWLAKLWGEPIADRYEDARPVDTSFYNALRARLRRPVTAGHYPELLDYCRRRSLVPATLDAWRVTTCGEKALRFPLFAFDGGRFEMANARIRRVLDSPEDLAREAPRDWFEAKGGATCLAMGNHLLGVAPRAWAAEEPSWALNWVDPTRRKRLGSPFPSVRRVLVVEGQWDAMTAWQLGIPNVLSLPNGASAVDVSGLLRYVPEDAEVWIATDMDEAGNRAAESFFSQLDPDRVARLVLPEKDLNDWFRKDPTLTAERVLATAKGISVRVSEVEPKAGRWLSLSAPEEEAEARAGEIITETPWPRLNRRIGGGFRAAQTTGILAPSGIGKTTIANQIVAHAAAGGVSCGIIQLEGGRPAVRAKLRAQVKGWASPDLEENELAEIFARILLSPLEGKATKIEATLTEAEAMAEAGARLIVVDNWDYVVADGLAGDRTKTTAYGKFQEICKRFNAHGVVVWQPNKIDRNEKVNSGTQKGTSRAFQDADVYINVNRFGNARRLEVEKARADQADDSEAASLIWLRYDREKVALFETEGHADLSPVDEKGSGNPP